MLSPAEKRFTRYWEDQRKGGRWLYYLLYIPIGTFICSLILSVFLYLFFQVTLGSKFLWFVFLGGLAASFILTVYSWSFNEKKIRRIVQREIDEGRQKDQEPA